VPAGTSLAVSVLSNLGSKTSQVEDVVKGALAKSLVIDGITAVPKGAEMRGVVSDAKESGRVKGKASLGIAFDRLVVRGETHQIQTAPVVLEAQDKKSDDVKKGGLGAAAGAVVGGIAGGGTGAAIGAVAGGAGTVLATKGKEVEVPAGTVINVLMQSPLTLQVPIKQQ
jgi:L-aminopeptidase/D-esterase-like protein